MVVPAIVLPYAQESARQEQAKLQSEIEKVSEGEGGQVGGGWCEGGQVGG